MRACEAAKLIDEMTPARPCCWFFRGQRASCVRTRAERTIAAKPGEPEKNPPANHGE